MLCTQSWRWYFVNTAAILWVMYIFQYLQKVIHWLFAPCLIPSNGLSFLIIFQSFFFPLFCLQMSISLQVIYKGHEYFQDIWRTVTSPKVQHLFGIVRLMHLGQNCSYKALLPLAKHSGTLASLQRNSSAGRQLFFLHLESGIFDSKDHQALVTIWNGCRFGCSDSLLPCLQRACGFPTRKFVFFFFLLASAVFQCTGIILSKVKLNNNKVENGT